MFLLQFSLSVWVKMWVSDLTHTVTHTPKGPERFKECRTGRFAFPPGIFFSVLHDLLHEIAHGLGGLVLLLPGGVGVGAQGKPGVKSAPAWRTPFSRPRRFGEPWWRRCAGDRGT